LLNLVLAARNSGDTYQGGHRDKHYHYKQAIWRKNEGKSLAREKKIWILAM
jgi:hypothetical protein